MQFGEDLAELYGDVRSASRQRRRLFLWDLLRNGLAVRVDEAVDRFRRWRHRRGRAVDEEPVAPPARSPSAAVGGPPPWGGGERWPPGPIPRKVRLPMDSWLQDLRYAVRMFRKSPVASAVAVLSLAIGIGANTATFGFVDAALLETLPVEGPEELVVLHWAATPQSLEDRDFSIDGWLVEDDAGRYVSSSFGYSTFEALRDSPGLFSDTFAFADLGRINVRLDGGAELTTGQVVSGNYYAALGLRAAAGRLLTEADDRLEAEPVAVISHGYWQRRFGGDPGVVGATLFINGSPFTVVGVSPRGFQGTLQVGTSPAVSLPLAMQSRVMQRDDLLVNPAYWWLHVMGRVSGAARGAGAERADAVFDQAVAAALSVPEGAAIELLLEPGGRGLTEARSFLVDPLFALSAVVALVLLIACMNVANLSLSRAGARASELAVRRSLGAGRTRLLRQLLTESLVVAFAGGAVGLLVAHWGRGLLVGILGRAGDGLLASARLDPGVLGFSLTLTLLAGVAFGIVPAWRASSVEAAPLLRCAAGRASGTSSPWSKALMTAQVAMSLVLLVAAGLFVRTLQNLEERAGGFDPRGVLVARIDPTLNGYTGERLASLFENARRRALQTPGVLRATVASHSPLSGRISTINISIEGYAAAEGERLRVFRNIVGPGFFETFAIPVLTGRPIDERDDAAAPRVAVVNRSFVERFFPGESPIGRRFGFGGAEHSADFEIVGVAADVRYQSARDDMMPVAHVSYLQAADSLRTSMMVAVRTASEATSIAGPLGEAIRAVDPDVPLFEVRSMAAQQQSTLAQELQFARLASLLGAVALALASIGLYGVLSSSVVRRTREIGIRMALGARAKHVLAMVAGDVVPVLAGVAIGLLVARWATAILAGLLYGLTPGDPLSMAAAVVVLLIVAAVAAWFPARRAARVDPAVALRLD